MTKSRFQRSRPYREGYLIPAEESHSFPQRVKLRNPKNTIWSSVKEFINALEPNEEFKRKEILNYIYTVNMAPYENIVDWYRHLLTILKFLDHVGRGLYKKKCDVPIKLTTTQLREYAYGNSWKSWFIPLELIE